MKQGVIQAIMISNLFWARNHSLRSLVVFWIPIFKHFQSKAVFAHLCLEVRSYTLRSRVFSFELKEQMLRIGLCVIHFFASDVNAWTRCYICSIMVPTFAWKQLVGAGRLAYRVALSATGGN